MKGLYRWHRRLSLIIALPVVLSAGSGFLHPIMTNIRPVVATQGLRSVAIDSFSLHMPLSAALDSNHLDSISRVRVVHIDTNWFYQVQRWEADVPVYLSTKTGKKLPMGDWLYAQWLAREFLEGDSAGRRGRPSGDAESTLPDCCGAATLCVLNAKGSQVTGATRLTDFDRDYNEVNRLLPVYRVGFDRADGIRIYVETTQDRFALAVDNRRAAFNRVFEYIHTYEWLNFLGEGKGVVEFLLIGLAFATTVLGIVIFFSSKSKRVKGNGTVRARRNHRYTAIIISLFTLAFTFSGAYHLAYKQPRDRRVVLSRFGAEDVSFDLRALEAAAGGRVSGVGLVRMEGKRYWRVRVLGGGGRGGSKDLMRDMQVAAPEIVYVNAVDSTVLPDGERRYAQWLAGSFSGYPAGDIVSTTLITKFDRDYNFTDKRLPVWKVAYGVHHNERYYVETMSGALSVRVNDLDLIEGYSFALLHKHEFLGGLGKPVKDFSTMFWAAAQVLLVVLGLVLWMKKRA